MRKLLVPVDGSPSALNAIRHALAIAKACGNIELDIVTAHPDPVVYGEVKVFVGEEKMAELQKARCESLLAPAVKLAAEAGVRTTTGILTGEPAHAIAERAEKGGADAIIMGTRGMGAVGNLVLGSIATKVVHLAKVPVTLVK